MGGRRRAPPTEPRERVAAVLEHPDVCFFPVRHHSPTCAYQVRAVIEALSPVAVLVEGPDDATPLIDALLDPETVPPVAILSTWVDKRNQVGGNGVLTATEQVAARYRGWWPLLRYSPEYVALQAGRRVGAELGFIDTPLKATVPHRHLRQGTVVQAVNDRQLAESRYLDHLAARTGARDFDEWWEQAFEVGGMASDPRTFMESALMFAWCTRAIEGAPEGLEADGTLLREAHMAWHLREARKRHPDGWIVVVTGAYHSVALPWTRPKRAKAKADRDTTTVLTGHSDLALARLYHQNRLPAVGREVWEQAQDLPESAHQLAADHLMLQVLRQAREDGAPVSTGDAVVASQVAGNLARLRRNRAPTRFDLMDAIQLAYTKGEQRLAGAYVEAASRRVLVGARVGRVSPLAGQLPLLVDFATQARQHRIDVSGAHKVVRCDLLRREAHRHKSAFLHQCELLDLPMFASTRKDADDWRDEVSHYRGPDPLTGQDMHLLGETWGVRWSPEVDDVLVSLADRGATVSEVAASLVRDALASAGGHAGTCARLLLSVARMGLLDLLPEAVEATRRAIATDKQFGHLVEACGRFVVLLRFRDTLQTVGVERLEAVLAALRERATLEVDQLARVAEDQAEEAVADLAALARLTAAEGWEHRPLVERLRRLDRVATPQIRGAALGVRHAFGDVQAATLAEALEGLLLGAPSQSLGAGQFLDGLFATSRSAVLVSPDLVEALDRVLASLPWERFVEVLPDLRRAFTRFIPAELHTIGSQVASHLEGHQEDPLLLAPTPAERDWMGAADEAAARWLQRP